MKIEAEIELAMIRPADRSSQILNLRCSVDITELRVVETNGGHEASI